jgi:hypothetical protein
MSPQREIKGYNYDMIWHSRLNDDPARRWFREQVRILGKYMSKTIAFLLAIPSQANWNHLKLMLVTVLFTLLAKLFE